MFPRLAYTGTHERVENAEDVTYAFLVWLAATDFDREELSQLPAQSGGIAKPFSVLASIILASNDSNADVILD